MDCGLSYTKISLHQSLPFAVKTLFSSSSSAGFAIKNFPSRSSSAGFWGCRRSLVVVASGSKCEFSGLNAPLEPRTEAGRLLSSVLQNDRKYFHVAVQRQLELLAYDREDAVARMNLSLGSDEALLHRLEIWPCRDWELESIHSFEVLEMVKEHLTTVLRWKEKSNVRDNWAPTKVRKLQLCQVYGASVLYGYFLKSASLRHHLEQKLDYINPDLGIANYSQILLSEVRSLGSETVPFGRISGTRSTSVGRIPLIRGKKQEKLKYYVMSFDPETLQMCAKPKSKEALSLIEKHSYALFGDEKTGLVTSDEVISTSLASLKRIVLEAIAFGSFLWDAGEYVRTVYKLNEN